MPPQVLLEPWHAYEWHEVDSPPPIDASLEVERITHLRAGNGKYMFADLAHCDFSDSKQFRDFAHKYGIRGFRRYADDVRPDKGMKDYTDGFSPKEVANWEEQKDPSLREKLRQIRGFQGIDYSFWHRLEVLGDRFTSTELDFIWHVFRGEVAKLRAFQRLVMVAESHREEMDGPLGSSLQKEVELLLAEHPRVRGIRPGHPYARLREFLVWETGELVDAFGEYGLTGGIRLFLGDGKELRAVSMKAQEISQTIEQGSLRQPEALKVLSDYERGREKFLLKHHKESKPYLEVHAGDVISYSLIEFLLFLLEDKHGFIECEECGERFPARRGNKRFCIECYQERRREQARRCMAKRKASSGAAALGAIDAR